MKSSRVPKPIFVGGAILALLALISLGLALPQARTTGRPAVYGFRLPDLEHASGLGFNAYGKNSTPYYPNSSPNDVYWDDDVNVQAGVTRYQGSHCDQIYFVVERTTPDNWAALQGIMIDPNFTVTPNTETCGFPGQSGGSYPSCIQQFLNQSHPLEGYDHIQFRVHIFTYLEDIKTEMGRLKLCNGDWGVIYLWTRSECDEALGPPYSPYHRITAKFRTSDDSGTDGGLYIERIDSNTWRIYVEKQIFSIEEYYCLHELVTGKNGKSYYGDKRYTSFEGSTYPVTYTYDLIKK